MSPVSGFITPFLARKGDGGMVERAVGGGVRVGERGVRYPFVLRLSKYERAVR